MESTGVYHLKVASYLASDLGLKVAVVNPLVINRYMQMNLSRCKSDKADSKQIASYGYQYSKDITLYIPKGETQIENILKTIDDFNNQLTITNNQLHSLSFIPKASKKAIASYNKAIDFFNNHSLKKELEDITKNNFKDDIDLLKSIPGVGDTLSSIIIGFFGGFKNFNRAKEVISFIGLNPSVYQSGTSVKGEGSISKKGNPYVRKILYVCAWSEV
jgi:transposase